MTQSPATTTLLYSSALLSHSAPAHVPDPPLAIAWLLATVIVGIITFAVIDGLSWRRSDSADLDAHRLAHARSWSLLHPGAPMPPCARCMTTRTRG